MSTSQHLAIYQIPLNNTSPLPSQTHFHSAADDDTMGDAASQINRGALNAIFFQQDLAAAQFQVPVLQCLQIKPMVST